MREPPAGLDEAALRAGLAAAYGLAVAELTFLPLGHDASAWAYRARAADGGVYFLKLRRRLENPAGLLVPHHLRARGLGGIIAPLPTVAGALWAEAAGHALILYPYIAGRGGMEGGLSARQWVDYGALLRQVHDTPIDTTLAGLLRRESFTPVGLDVIARLDEHLGERDFDEPAEAALAPFWRARRADLGALAERAAALGRRLAERAPAPVLCHADIHTGNVLLGDDGRVWFVDWDETLLAPPERDLMFVVGGIIGGLIGPREEALFFRGYGEAAVDPLALAYYRCAWATADIAAYGEQVCFRPDLGPASRREGVEFFQGLFRPGNIVDLAERSDEGRGEPA